MKRPEYILEGERSPKYIPSEELFGEMGDFWNFDPGHYRHLLWVAKTPSELIEGLQEIQPFVDDALAIARKMSRSDLRHFKEALGREEALASEGEEAGRSAMPPRWQPLLLPRQFALASLVAIQAEAPLGAVLMRLLESGELNSSA